jgi:hypothetical protein
VLLRHRIKTSKMPYMTAVRSSRSYESQYTLVAALIANQASLVAYYSQLILHCYRSQHERTNSMTPTIDQQNHHLSADSYEIQHRVALFSHLCNSLPRSVSISPYHATKIVFTRTDYSDLLAFYFEPLINPISLRGATPKNASLSSLISQSSYLFCHQRTISHLRCGGLKPPERLFSAPLLGTW